MSLHSAATSQTPLRQGEEGVLPRPRTRRIFALAGSGGEPQRWYFKTREGALVGAFASERDAEKGVQDFVEFVTAAPAPLRARFLQHLGTREAGRG